jgi:hypothetical protein
MYKLFLTVRYLTRKKIVLFPILVVWLCLMMMIIVTSIMGGFVDRVREANRDLLGDVVISNNAGAGWPYYDELQRGLQKEFSSDIAAMSPVVRGYGLINLPAFDQTFFAQITGIDPVARSKVSRFRETLFRQYIAPKNAIEDLTPALPSTTEELRDFAQKREAAANSVWSAAYKRYRALRPDLVDDTPPVQKTYPNVWWLLGVPVLALLLYLRLRRRGQRRRTIFDWFSATAIFVAGAAIIGLGVAWPILFPRTFELVEDQLDQASGLIDRARQTLQAADSLPPGARYTTPQQLAEALIPKEPSFALPTRQPPGAPPMKAASTEDDEDAGPTGCFVGVQFPIFSRDKRGNFDRSLDNGEI